MEHLKHFWIEAFAVSALDHAYSLLDAWDTKSMLRMEELLLVFFCKYNSYSEIYCSQNQNVFRIVSSLKEGGSFGALCSSMIQAGSQHSWKPCCTLVSTTVTVLLFFTCVDKCTGSISSVSADTGPFSIDAITVQTEFL